MNLTEILSRRNTSLAGGSPMRFLELYGRRFVPLNFIEPDPSTSRSDFYYNTRQNVLYKRITAGQRFVWKRISF